MRNREALRAQAQALHGSPISTYSASTLPETGVPELKHIGPDADKDGWITFDKSFNYFYAGKGPFVSVDLMQFPVSHPDDGFIDVVIAERVSTCSPPQPARVMSRQRDVIAMYNVVLVPGPTTTNANVSIFDTACTSATISSAPTRTVNHSKCGLDTQYRFLAPPKSGSWNWNYWIARARRRAWPSSRPSLERIVGRNIGQTWCVVDFQLSHPVHRPPRLMILPTF